MCPCGLENYDLEDWLAHWKYGLVMRNSRFGPFLGKHPKLRAIWMFLNTRIEFR